MQRWRWWPGNEALRGSAVDPAAPQSFAQGLIVELALDLGAAPRITLEVDGQPYLITVQRDGTVGFSTAAPAFDCSAGTAPTGSSVSAPRAACRILVRRGMLELYLDDHFIECWTMGCAEAATVRLDPAATAGGVAARAWSMDLPPQAG